MLRNNIAVIKFFWDFYHQRNIIAARNLYRSWNCNDSSMYFHIFNDFVISYKLYSLLQKGHVSAHQPWNNFCYRSHRLFFESFCFCGYVFIPQLFPIWQPGIVIVIYRCSKSNIQCKHSYQFSLHLYTRFAHSLLTRHLTSIEARSTDWCYFSLFSSLLR